MRRRAIVLGVIGGTLFAGSYVGVRIGAPRRADALGRQWAGCLQAQEERRTAMEPLRACAAEVRAGLRMIGWMPGLAVRGRQLSTFVDVRLAERELRHASSTSPDLERRTFFARSVHALAGGSLGFEPDWLPASSFDLNTPATDERNLDYKLRAATFLADVGAIDRLLVGEPRWRCARGDLDEGRRLFRAAMQRHAPIDLGWARWCGLSDQELATYDPLGYDGIQLQSPQLVPTLPEPSVAGVLEWASPEGPTSPLRFEDALVRPTRLTLEPSPADVGTYLDPRPTPTDHGRYRFAAVAEEVGTLTVSGLGEVERARLRRLEWVLRLGAATVEFRKKDRAAARAALVGAEAIAPIDAPSVALWFRLALGDLPMALHLAEAACARPSFAALPLAERARVEVLRARALSRAGRYDDAYAAARSADESLSKEVGPLRQEGDFRPMLALSWTRVALAVRTGHLEESEPPYLAAQAALRPPGHRGVSPYLALSNLLALRRLKGDARAEARARLSVPSGPLDGYVLYLLGTVADGAPEVLLDWLLRSARPTVGFAWLRAEAARLHGDEAARVSWLQRVDRLATLPGSPW